MLVKPTVATLTGAAALGLFYAPVASADNTLTLFERDTVQHSADLGAPGPGPGDQFIFAGDVFDRPGGLFLGTMGGSCSTLTGNQTVGQQACNEAINLADGQVVIQGVCDTAALFVRGDRCSVSIVGGTGMYQNGHGVGTIQVPPEVPDQTDAHVVLNVTDS